jgi:ubiquitin-small subunit ribosomal protein S27Ae
MGKKSKDAKRREKKQRTGKKHLTLKPHEYYEISGDNISRKKKNCPRCGPGTWLGEHKGRVYCGKCGYSEFERKPEQPSPQKQEKPAESAPVQKQAQKTEASTQKHPEGHKQTDNPADAK